MKEKIKASILIANYNNAKFLDECLKSILNQNYKNKEIIVLDDSSTDNSKQILNNYNNKILVVEKNEAKKNIASYDQFRSYVKCFEASKGDIIFLCDSDDFFLDKKIEKIIARFENDEYCKILFDLPILKFDQKIQKKKIKKKIFDNYWPYIPPTSCISIRKSFFQKIIEDIDFSSYTDLWLDFRLGIISKYKLKKLSYFNENLTFYRQTDNNISSKFRFSSQNWWKRRNQAHDYVKSFHQKNNLNFKKNFDYHITKLINSFFK